MFDTFPEIFQSDLFKVFTTKLMKYMYKVEDANDTKIDHVPPCVLNNVDAHTRAIKELREDLT